MAAAFRRRPDIPRDRPRRVVRSRRGTPKAEGSAGSLPRSASGGPCPRPPITDPQRMVSTARPAISRTVRPETADSMAISRLANLVGGMGIGGDERDGVCIRDVDVVLQLRVPARLGRCWAFHLSELEARRRRVWRARVYGSTTSPPLCGLRGRPRWQQRRGRVPHTDTVGRRVTGFSCMRRSFGFAPGRLACASGPE